MKIPDFQGLILDNVLYPVGNGNEVFITGGDERVANLEFTIPGDTETYNLTIERLQTLLEYLHLKYNNSDYLTVAARTITLAEYNNSDLQELNSIWQLN